MDSISQQLHQGVQSFCWEKANELWGPYNEEADDTCCANTYCAASAPALGVAYKLIGEFLSEVDFRISAYFPEISFLINFHSFFFFFFLNKTQQPKDSNDYKQKGASYLDVPHVLITQNTAG